MTGIAPNTKESEIRALFEERDWHVEEVRLIRDPRTGKAKGFAYVQMVSEGFSRQALGG